MQKRRRADRGLILISAIFLLAGCVALTFFPAARFSAVENRNLADLPAFSTAGIADGSFTAALDTYATERFPARRALRGLRGVCQLAEGKCEVGGILLCTDGSLCKRMTVNDRAYAQNLSALQALQSAYGEKLTVAIAPRRIDARTAVLPVLYDQSENAGVWQTLHEALPDAVTFPALNTDAHWYRTDHHWSTEGAYRAYCHLGKVMGFAPYGEDAFTRVTVSESFLGTSDAAAGLPFITPDSITLYRYAGDTSFEVQKDGKSAPFTGFYDAERLSKRDQYAVFFGGNCGVLEIKSQEDHPSLLVIKDSFANSLLPFLSRHYNITAIDPRYCTDRIEAHESTADQILILCNMQTITESAVFRTLIAPK